MRRVEPEIKASLAEENPDAVLWDGCDEALCGIARRCSQPTLAVYDYDELVDMFRREGCSIEEAVEHIEFNMAGAWLGEHTPLIIYR